MHDQSQARASPELARSMRCLGRGRANRRPTADKLLLRLLHRHPRGSRGGDFVPEKCSARTTFSYGCSVSGETSSSNQAVASSSPRQTTKHRFAIAPMLTTVATPGTEISTVVTLSSRLSRLAYHCKTNRGLPFSFGLTDPPLN